MKTKQIKYCKAQTEEQLLQILQLQKSNLASSIDKQTLESQGFVTAQHDLKLLTEMNQEQAHAIALDGDQVVGYALSMTTKFSKRLPVLIPMFEMISSLEYKGVAMDKYSYFIMGQVCIAPNYRSTGIFFGLYQQLKKANSNAYDFIITEIDQRNTRSIAAHKKVGFELLHSYCSDAEIVWDLVIWNWK
jgi:hypothetical protein